MTDVDPSAEERRGPEHELADALLPALAPGLRERQATALHLAELLLDATEAALVLSRGGPDPARDPAGNLAPDLAALAQLELLATRADVFGWDGPPGWDVILVGGLVARAPLPPGASFLDGLATARSREEQLARLLAQARSEAEKFLAHASSAARGGSLVAAHASLLRLLGLAAAAPALSLPEELPAPRELPGSATAPAVDAARLAVEPDAGTPEEALIAEMDARAAQGSEFAAAQEEWLARLQHGNPAAKAHPSFRTFFAGLATLPRVAMALREFRDEARQGRLAADPEALLGAIGGFQPVRWAALRRGAPAALIARLCPEAPAGESTLARLARECSAALELAGRLWFARAQPLSAFTALSGLFVARCASALALWEELLP